MSDVQGLKLMKEYVSRYTEYKKLEDRVKIDKSLANPALSEKLKQEINTLEKKIISEISFDIYDGLFSITKEFLKIESLGKSFRVEPINSLINLSPTKSP